MNSHTEKKKREKLNKPKFNPMSGHTVNSGSKMIKALYISKFWIQCVKMLEKMEKLKKFFLYIVLFCKSILSKIKSPPKQTKTKNGHQFQRQTFKVIQFCQNFCPIWFLHSKGPKIATCRWLSHDLKHGMFNLQSLLSWLSQRQIAILGPLD